MTEIETPDNPGNPFRTALMLVVLAYILIYLLPLGVRPLSTPDETRYGQIPWEMIQSGDWAVPHLTGLRYFEKPPMGYWLNAVSISVFGKNNFAVRFATALAVGLSAWFVWLLLIRLGFGRTTALTAAAIYLGLAEVLIVGTVAVLDSPFNLFLTGGLVLFYLGVNTGQIMQQRRDLVGSGILFGLAFLTKGFLAIALPGMVLFAYALLQRRYILLWKSVLVAGIAILTILPWAIIIHLREPDFWHYFIWEEHIRRFLAADAQHKEPIYYFLMFFPAMAFPWFWFLPAAISGLRQENKNPDLLRYLILWFALPFIFFSISKGKLATYILPVFAPVAVIMASGILSYLKQNKKRLFALGAVINALLLLVLTAVVVHQQYYEPGNALFSGNESGRMQILIVSLLLMAALFIVSLFLKRSYARITVVISTIVPLFVFLNFVVPNSTLSGRSPITLFEKYKSAITPDTILISDANVMRAVAWVLDRTDISYLTTGELGYGLSYPESKHRLLGYKGLDKLLQQHDAGSLNKNIAVYCEEPCPPGIADLLKQHHGQHLSANGFALWLVGHSKH